jgi:glycosyltransferase involved in cell wall biosynthesis
MIASRCKLYVPVVALGLLYGVRVALFRHLTYLKHWYQRQLITRLADRFYVVSQFAQDALAREGACRDRLTPLYNPIDLERFQPVAPAERSTLRAKLGFTEDDVVAGYVGRIESPKGADVLMDAACELMARVPELKVLWVGDGSSVPALRARAVESGFAGRHLFVGWQCHVEKYMAALDCLVVPSLEAEAFGRVMAEAQACAVPVITSGTGGLPESYLPGVTGLLAPAGDVRALSEAMELLARNVPLRIRLAAAGRDFVRARFASTQVAAAFTRHLSAQSLIACEPAASFVPLLRSEKHEVKLTV